MGREIGNGVGGVSVYKRRDHTSSEKPGVMLKRAVDFCVRERKGSCIKSG